MHYNGCGSAGFNNDVLNKLNVGYKTTLEAACNKHDICYNCVSVNFKSNVYSEPCQTGRWKFLQK